MDEKDNRNEIPEENAAEAVEETAAEAVEESAAEVAEEEAAKAVEETAKEETDNPASNPAIRRIYQGTESERHSLRRKILSFAIVCVVCVAGALVTGFFGPVLQFPFTVFAVGEAVLGVALVVLACILASQRDQLKENIYLLTIAAIPGVCIALILCDALTIIAALVQLGRSGAEDLSAIFLLASLVLRLVCMEFSHLCRKTVTHSVWTMVHLVQDI